MESPWQLALWPLHLGPRLGGGTRYWDKALGLMKSRNTLSPLRCLQRHLPWDLPSGPGWYWGESPYRPISFPQSQESALSCRVALAYTTLFWDPLSSCVYLQNWDPGQAQPWGQRVHLGYLHLHCCSPGLSPLSQRVHECELRKFMLLGTAHP